MMAAAVPPCSAMAETLEVTFKNFCLLLSMLSLGSSDMASVTLVVALSVPLLRLTDPVLSAAIFARGRDFVC